MSLLTIALWPAGAAAQIPVEPLPYSSMLPGDGAVFPPQGENPLSFEFTSPQRSLEGSVEIATRNVPGVDGTLADDYKVGLVVMLPRDSSPGTYRGTSNYGSGSWTNKPGVYYWQVHMFGYDRSVSPAQFHDYLGPVRSLSIQGQPPRVPVYSCLRHIHRRKHIHRRVHRHRSGRRHIHRRVHWHRRVHIHCGYR